AADQADPGAGNDAGGGAFQKRAAAYAYGEIVDDKHARLLTEVAARRNPSESVPKVHEGLQSFLSMRRMEARRKKTRALRLRFSQSLASLRQRFSQAIERSTIQRFGRTTKPFT